MRIERYPDGTFIIRADPEEIEEVKRKLEKGMELDDREICIAREFLLN